MIAIFISADGLRRAISIPKRQDEIHLAVFPFSANAFTEPDFAVVEATKRTYVLWDRKARDVYVYRERVSPSQKGGK